MTLTCPRCQSTDLSIKAELSTDLFHVSALVECGACKGLFSLTILEHRGALHLEWGKADGSLP